MSAEWFNRKKEQLRLLGRHPVPGTKAKDVTGVDKEASVATHSKGNMMSMNRGSRMLMLSMADKVADKFRKKNVDNHEKVMEKSKNVVEKDSFTVESDNEDIEAASALSSEHKLTESVDSQSKSWGDVVKEAGGLLVMASDPIPSDEDEDDNGVTQSGEEHRTHQVSHISDDPEGTAKEESSKKKKKTPLQYRTMQPKRMAEETISSSNKKMFKEAWNTDKSRMEKRQVKYNKPQNFLLILEDNIHQSGHDHGAKTAGKLMVYGKGPIREKFLKTGIQYNPCEYVMHANAHNFEVDNVKVDAEDVGEVEGVKEDDRDMTTQTEKTLEKNQKRSKERNPLYNMKSVARKVHCPGSLFLDDSDDDDDSEGKDSSENE